MHFAMTLGSCVSATMTTFIHLDVTPECFNLISNKPGPVKDPKHLRLMTRGAFYSDTDDHVSAQVDKMTPNGHLL